VEHPIEAQLWANMQEELLVQWSVKLPVVAA